MAWEENSCISLNMQLIAILSRIGVLTYFGSKENVHFFKAFTSKNTTFTAVECVFAYRCLFPYLTKVKLGCTRKRKQVFFSLVSTSFAAHLQHAHANSLFIDSVHFEEVK